MEGIFAVYKPAHMTSFDVVAIVRKISGVKRVGHGGTLDPLARGVLVIAVGRESTKQLSHIVEAHKEYRAVIRLGATSTTDDEEGEKKIISVLQPPRRQVISKTLKQFIGEISQIPPIYSAIKVRGKPAHRRVRSGQMVTLGPRQVQIQSITILKYRWPLLTLQVGTGKGVYIRALARDIGAALGVGGYLTDLERTRVGQFSVSNAYSLEDLASKENKKL